MEITPIGRPRETWLENVEADMAELEIDREDINYRKKWRNNVMKSNPIGKDYKPIITGLSTDLLHQF